ncbi:hypothetical protein T484DRAFT_3638480, partial [Baffinella frigidus]
MRLTLALSLAAVLLALPLFTQAYVLAGARPVRASQVRPRTTHPRGLSIGRSLFSERVTFAALSRSAHTPPFTVGHFSRGGPGLVFLFSLHTRSLKHSNSTPTKLLPLHQRADFWRAAPRAPPYCCVDLPHPSQPAATRPRRAPDASEASSSVSVARDEDGAAGAAGATPGGVESDLQRLFMTADNPSVRESRIAGVVIKDVKV